MHLFGGAFQKKVVLITGHTGFKGAWLSIWLKELGARVVGYSLEPPSNPNLFEQTGLSKKIESIAGDVRDLAHLKKVIGTAQPEIVFHLAAQPLVRMSYTNPVETVSTNILGTVHVLEAIRQSGPSVRACQIITSDKCYSNDESNHAYTETDRMGGYDPYSASKGCAELMVSAYRNSFFPPETISQHGLSVSSVRAGNVIGGGDWGQDRVVHDCIRALTEDRTISLRNPQATRPWQYVLDVLAGYLRLAEEQMTGSSLYADAWNLGPDETQNLTVQDLTEKIIKNWGRGSWAHKKNSDASNSNTPHEATFLRLNASKANKLLEWRPVLTIDENIAQTVAWYRNTLNHKKSDEFYRSALNQIKTYIQMSKERKHPWALEEQAIRER